jgi:hypothetical protein
MRRFGKPSGTLRAAAALVSLSLTAAIFMLLRASSTTAPPKRDPLPVAVALVLSPPARARPLPTTTPSEARAATRDPRRVVPSSRPASPQRALSEAITGTGPAIAPAEVAAAPGAETEPASAPLRLDPRTIGRAIAGSEGPIRQMARGSGVDLDSPKESRSEALAGAVADKGVPDCLAPNGGGSLLSVPIVLVLAMQGKCK